MKKKQFLALFMTVALAVQMPLTAYAVEDEPIKVSKETEEEEGKTIYVFDGDVTITEAEAGDAAVYVDGKNGNDEEDNIPYDVTVNGDITATGDRIAGVRAHNGVNVTVNGDIETNDKGGYTECAGNNISGIVATGNSEVKVSGNVTVNEDNVSHTSSPSVYAEDSTVTVGGNVTSTKNNCGVTALGNSTVTVNGDVISNNYSGIFTTGKEFSTDVHSGSTIIVGGNVTGSLSGMNISNRSTVIVGGNVTAEHYWGISAGNGSTIIVGGNVTGGKEIGNGISTDNVSNINVSGDVSSEISAGVSIRAREDSELENGKILIKGSVKGNDTAFAIEANYDDTIDPDDDDDVNSFLDSIPEIIVGELVMGKDGYLSNAYSDKLNEQADLTESEEEAAALRARAEEINDTILLEKIKYIVADTTDFENCVMKISNVSGSEYVDDKYYVACEGTRVIVTLTANDGYEITAADGSNVSVTRNSDGTYSADITVKRGGGISISAILKAIAAVETASGSSSGSGETASGSSSGSGETASPQLIAIVYAAIQKAIQAEVLQIERDGTFEIDMGDYISFNRKTFEAFTKRPDVTFNITYSYNKHNYLVTIPAGYPIMDLLDENGYCGCLYLNALFGSVQLD